MPTVAHVNELKRKHSRLESELQEAKQHKSMEEKTLVALKRKKLALKDEMSKFATAQ
jgi:hypothetical protein